MNATEKRKELYGMLGDLPNRNLPVTVKTVAVEPRDGYVLEKLVLDVCAGTADNPDGERIPAYFAKPQGEGPFPAILFSHSHGGFYQVGKDELLSPAPYMYRVPYAEALTRQGYAVLAIDAWCFGERSGRPEQDTFKEMLWRGQVLFGKMIYDSLKALDYLCAREDVMADRIGALGMSMGSTMSWWLTALDERIKVCADICCMTDYDALIADHGIGRHGFYYYVPGLLKRFTSPEINALIAPRARLATIGKYDGLTPQDGVDRIEAYVSDVYRQLNAPEGSFRVLRYPVGHRETAEMRQDILDFLAEHL